ncbi:MAG: bifunctional methionine sulfoxide reductase B/A protein [Ignavibacteriae bacterium]|nr:bifunctional methionine sulfoxide reductase B/A protein [Ignavibacteriota bacterium]
MEYNKLTSEEKRVIIDKGTEMPFTGKYVNYHENGTYTCKRCGSVLFNSGDKFDSECGWPSFDDAIPGTVKKLPDPDGLRTEIECAKCGAHLGHVFYGEGFTSKDTRYCVNSISLNFTPKDNDLMDTGYFAGGCFWGIEYEYNLLKGVKSVKVGYMGGKTSNPTYEEVCSGRTGHYETAEVVFDPSQVTYEDVAKYFFEIHDPTQSNGQGPDIGEQYLSVVFYKNDAEKETAEKLIGILKNKGYKVATKLIKAETFWKAEDYHQDYYSKSGKTPYCHVYTKRF